MGISFTAVRNTGLCIIMILLVVFAGVYYHILSDTIHTLETTANQHLSVLDTLITTTKYADEARRLFDLYVKEPRLYGRALLDPINQLISLVQQKTDDSDNGRAMEDILQALRDMRLATYSYLEEHQRNSGNTTELKTGVQKKRNHVNRMFQQLFDPSHTAVSLPKATIENLLAITKNTFDRFDNQDIVEDAEIIDCQKKLYDTCEILHGVFTGQGQEMIDTALHGIRVLQIAEQDYMYAKRYDSASATTSEMEKATIKADQMVQESLSTLIACLRGEVVSAQKHAVRQVKRTQQGIMIAVLFGCVVIMFVTLFFARFVSYRIGQLLEGTKRFSAGDWTYRINILSHDAFGALASSFNAMVAQLRQTTVSREYVTNILETMQDALFVFSFDLKIVDVNRRVSALLGYTKEELIGQAMHTVFSNADQNTARYMRAVLKKKGVSEQEMPVTAKDGTRLRFLCSYAVMKEPRDNTDVIIMVAKDMTERYNNEQERERLQQELHHAQKMESIGVLAAGIAHEINTPIQFIGSNAEFIEKSIEHIVHVLTTYSAITRDNITESDVRMILKAARRNSDKVDVSFIEQEVKGALVDIKEGVDRVAGIVNAMKNFAHMGGEKSKVDINQAIINTVTISRNEHKHIADVQCELDPDLPMFECVAGDIQQVVLNLIVNAAHAIKDVVADGAKGRIVIATVHTDDAIVITLSDTGGGISTEHQDKVFDPFFTTKKVGEGSGQGLSISHGIIVKKYSGKLFFKTVQGEGTTFTIILPLRIVP